MVWNAQNSPFAGGGNFASIGAPNYGAYSAPNYGANGGHNYGAYSAPNYGAHAGHNYGAYVGPNYGAYVGPNYGAYAAPNYAVYPVMGPASAAPFPTAPAVAGGTGAGSASGGGFATGYGPVARFEYATPAGLAPVPWVLDFALSDGWPSFPFDQRINPYHFLPALEWQAGDWDPALRFWTLAFDPRLTEWLQDLNLAAPAVMAAREFAQASDKWLASSDPSTSGDLLHLHTRFESDTKLFAWRPSDSSMKPLRDLAWTEVNRELDELVDLMRDDRMRFLEELRLQSSQATPYFVHLMGFDPATKPWTMELMNCATSIGNLVKMQYKSHYKRVRPSTLCPALTPPWGPAQHPSFPSGHSTVGHLVALFLLSVPGIYQRFGVFPAGKSAGEAPQLNDFLAADSYGTDQRSPLLWLAWRIAKGRERLGVHYASDSAAGRRLAALVWDACLGATAPAKINVPALNTVLLKAQAEWPKLGP
jgi:hypothetical protein